MKLSSEWLTKLKAVELHKLAVLLGTPCSGTKAVVTQGIQNALLSLPKIGSAETSRNARAQGNISLISIDMGIRNLAYSHWTATLKPHTKGEPAQYALPRLHAWRKINVSTAESFMVSDNDMQESIKVHKDGETNRPNHCEKESFEPIDYASRAYKFVRTVLDEHKPSHILIERQRFRSGGQAAVQEWTIRVGVFEGMLYAVIRSLIAERAYKNDLLVQPVLPARVNRYWLEGQSQMDVYSEVSPTSKRTAREVKLLKIELVRKLLRAADQRSQNRFFTTDEKVADPVSTFIREESRLSSKRLKASNPTSDISKLDDLSDCLLQGLGWIQWQNNRLKLDALKADAYSQMV